MKDVKIIIESDVMPTEDESKIKRAINNLFPLIEISVEEKEGKKIVGSAIGQKTLSEFRTLLKRSRIRAAARSILLKSISVSSITLTLNKQAAYAGQVSFTTDPKESPLGSITLIIQTQKPQEIINWLVPPKKQQNRM